MQLAYGPKEKLHRFINHSHLYKTKIETWLKSLGLAATLFGGLFRLTPDIDPSLFSVAYFIYSIALFMEFFDKLVASSRMPRKIFPLLIIVCGIAIFLDSITRWGNQGVGLFPISILRLAAYIPVILLFIDALSITMVEKGSRPSRNVNKSVVENSLFE
jgi:uncharacterized membrane protein YhhN